MNLSKKLERQVIGLVVFTVLFFIVSYMNGHDQDKVTQELKTYLQSSKFTDDFKQSSNPKIEVLVSYPQINFYITFEYYNRSRTYSSEEMLNAEYRKCDFILNLFEKLNADKPKKKKILNALATENIAIKNMYRNKYAETMYSSEVTLKNCEDWYPKK